MEREKEREYIIGVMEIDMKEILRMIIEKEQGVYYQSDGDRAMGDYINDKEVGMHVIFDSVGNVIEKNYE